MVLKDLHPELPIMHVKALPVTERKTLGFYECPIFITTMRGPTYVTTAWMQMESEESDPKKWILAGVALLMSAEWGASWWSPIINLKYIGRSKHSKCDLDAQVSPPLGPTLSFHCSFNPVAHSDRFLQLSSDIVLTSSDCEPTPAKCRQIDRKDCSHTLQSRQFENADT